MIVTSIDAIDSCGRMTYIDRMDGMDGGALDRGEASAWTGHGEVPSSGGRTRRAVHEALGDRIAEHAFHLDAAMHRLLTDLRIFDAAGAWGEAGARSCASWRSWRVGWDPGTAREHVRVARALGSLPLIDTDPVASRGRGLRSDRAGELPPGRYAGEVFARDRDRVVDEFDEDGEDRYRLVLWPEDVKSAVDTRQPR